MRAKSLKPRSGKQDELKAALELVRAEKDARAAAFKKEIEAVCLKHKVDIVKMEISVLDIDAEVKIGE